MLECHSEQEWVFRLESHLVPGLVHRLVCHSELEWVLPLVCHWVPGWARQ